MFELSHSFRHSSRVISHFLGIALSGLLTSGLFADTVTLVPVADTSIMQAFPTNNVGANEYFNAGTTQAYTTNRGLMKFDLAAVLPMNAKITAVALTLEVVRSPVDGDEPSSFGLHRLLRSWGEGNKRGHPPVQGGLGQPATENEVTFIDCFAFTTNSWAAPGGLRDVDYVSEFSSDTFVYGVNFSPYVFDSTPRMVADVQDWLMHPQTNFGWMLISRAETNNFTARRFASREDPFLGPLLTVDYFVPQFEQVTIADGDIYMRLTVERGYPYRIEFCDALSSNSWHSLTSIPPQSATTSVVVRDLASEPQRFYRVFVP